MDQSTQPLLSETTRQPLRPRTRISQRSEVVLLLLQALASLIFRLWLATITISILMYFVRRVSVHNIRHQNGTLISDRNVEILGAGSRFTGTPALFGKVLKDTLRGPAMFVNVDGCREFEFEFPKFDQSLLGPAIIDDEHDAGTDGLEPGHELEQVLEARSQNESRKLGLQKPTKEVNWIAVVQRGGCPFDTKVLNMQRAGFKAALIFNNQQSLEPTIRMSAHSDTKIDIFSAFMTRDEGLELASLVLQDTVILELKSRHSVWMSRDLLLSGLIDIVVLFVLVVITGTTFIFLGLALNLLHNLYTTGTLNLVQTLQQASILILSGQKTTNPPKLSKITFPKRILDTATINNSWREGGVKGHEQCPICIEEFVVGNTVRDLPCRHIFHTEWFKFLIVLIHGY